MLARIQETDLSVPYQDGAYWYYARTEEGKQYPILCRTKGHRRAGGGHPRRERARGGADVLLARRVRGQRRRPLPRLHDRRHGLPRLHALPEGPPRRRAAALQGGEGRLRGLGRGQRRRCSTPSTTRPSGRTASTATTSAGRRTRWSTRRATSCSAPSWAARAAASTCCSAAPATPRPSGGTCARGHADGRVPHRGAPRARARVRRRPPRRLVLHPHQRPAGGTSGW